jgi:hypothetical protein
MLPSIATRLSVAIKNLFTGSSLANGSVFQETLAHRRGPNPRLLNSGPATRDQLDQQHNDGYHEKNVDEAAHGVRTYQAKQPQN